MKKQLNRDTREFLLENLKELQEELGVLNNKISSELSLLNKIEEGKHTKEQKDEYINLHEMYLFSMNLNYEMTEKKIIKINEILINNEY
mgnify:CR=1 FL=1